MKLVERTFALLFLLSAGCAPTRLVPPLPPVPPRPELAATSQMSPPPVLPVVDAPEPVRTTVLANGLQLVVVERHTYPVVAARLLVDRGSFDLDDPGGAKVVQTVRFFARGGDGAVFERLSDVGAMTGLTWSTSANRDSEWVDALAPKESFDELVETLGEVTIAPKLGAREYARVASSVQRTGALTLAGWSDEVHSILFGEQAYGAKRPKTAIPAAEGQALHDRLFQPAYATLVIVGDVSADKVDAAVARVFAGWTSHGAPLPRKTAPPPALNGPRVALVQLWQHTQCLAGVFARGPEATSDDIEAFELAARLVGGNRGSALFAHLREESGAAESVNAWAVEMRAASYLSVSASFDSDKSVTGVRDILTAIQQLRSGQESDEEVAVARSSLLAAWKNGLSTVAGAAATYARWVALGRDPARLGEEASRIEHLSRKDVERVARDWLDSERLHVLFMGDNRWLDVGELHMGGAQTLEP